jgi:hypothetical protein
MEKLTIDSCEFIDIPDINETVILSSGLVANSFIYTNNFSSNISEIFMDVISRVCTIQNNTFTDCTEQVIFAPYLESLRISDNYISNCSGTPVLVTVSFGAANNCSEIITNNIIEGRDDGGSSGISLSLSFGFPDNFISNSLISGNRIYKCFGTNRTAINWGRKGNYNLNISDNILSNNFIGLRLNSSVSDIQPSGSVSHNIITDCNTGLVFLSDFNQKDIQYVGNTLRNNITNFDIPSGGNSDLVKFIDTNATKFISSSSTIEQYTSKALVDTTSGAFSLNVADLNTASAGHKLYIELDVDGGDLTVTPNTFIDGSNLIFTTAGDFATLEWTGSAWTTIDSNFNYLRVNDCGEICVNNATDFTSALSFAQEIGGGHIKLASGNYSFSSSLTIPENTFISGSDKNTTTLQTSVDQNFINANSGVRFEQLTIDGTNTTSNLVVVSNASEFNIKDCKLENIFGSNCACVMLDLPKSNTVVVDSCIFSEVAIFQNVFVSDNGGGISGQVGTTADQLTVKNSIFKNVSLGLGFYVFNLQTIKNAEVTDCLFENSTYDSIGLGITESVKIHNNKSIGGEPNIEISSVVGNTDITISACGNLIKDPTDSRELLYLYFLQLKIFQYLVHHQ